MEDDKLIYETFEQMQINTPESLNRNAIRTRFLIQAEHMRFQTPAVDRKQRIRWWQRMYRYVNLRKGIDFTIDRKWMPVMTALGIILLVVGMIFAQQIFDIFTQVESDQHIVSVMYGMGEEQVINRPISIEQASMKVDFPISIPSYVPEAYQHVGVFYWNEEERISIHYQCGSYRQLIVSLIASSLDNMSDLENQNLGILDVGASANIELMNINGVEGQYVRGAWIVNAPSIQFEEVDDQWTRTYNNNGEVSTLIPSSQIPVQGKWHNESELQRLLWYHDGILYIISNIGSRIDVDMAGECELNKEIYEAVANSLTLID